MIQGLMREYKINPISIKKRGIMKVSTTFMMSLMPMDAFSNSEIIFNKLYEILHLPKNWCIHKIEIYPNSTFYYNTWEIVILSEDFPETELDQIAPIVEIMYSRRNNTGEICRGSIKVDGKDYIEAE